MDFRDFAYVAAIARCQTISKAAETLFIAQPSLSKFLQKLESNIGVKLFERHKNKMFLTFAGERYVDTGQKIFALNKDLLNVLNDVAHNRSGELILGTTNARSKYVLPRVLPKFKELYSGYKVDVTEGDPDFLEAGLNNAALDLALYPVIQKNKNFIYHHISSEEILLAVSNTNPVVALGMKRSENARRVINLSLLNDQVFFILPEVWQIGKIGRILLKENGISPEQISVSSTETALSIVSKGLGICFCPSLMEKYFDSSPPPCFFSIDGFYDSDSSRVEFVIAHRKSMEITHAVDDFIKIVKTSFSN